ncbi:MAG: serine hydrolase [Sphaerobacter sp.]|nr:serine hydrolase [Sphaerobacter sp.]
MRPGGHPAGRTVTAYLAIIALLGLVLTLLAAPAAAAGPTTAGWVTGDAGARAVPPRPAAQLEPALPPLTARAALAVDLSVGTALLEHNADVPLPPASTTKMVTALVVRQHAAVDDIVTIQPDDLVDETVYAHMGLRAGDRVTVGDLLAGLLIPSGGDAALALARAVGARLEPDAPDPRAAFVAAMNRLARQLGMRQAHFANPDGRDAPGQQATARDLAVATAALLRDPLLAQVVATPVMTVQVDGPQPRALTLWSTNFLLGERGVHGVKTGTTDGAGQHLVAVARRRDHEVVTVILGSTDRFADTRALLDFLDARYQWVRLGRAGDLPALESALAAAGLTLMTNRTLLLTVEQAAALRYTLTRRAPAPGSPWAGQGEVVFYVGAAEVLRLPLYARDPGNPFVPSG